MHWYTPVIQVLLGRDSINLFFDFYTCTVACAQPTPTK